MVVAVKKKNKFRRKKDPIKEMLEADLHLTIRDALMQFSRSMIAQNNNNERIIKILRSMNMPDQNTNYAENDEFHYMLFNPSPENSFERAVSGFLSHHVSPVNRYFALEIIDYLATEAKRIDPDEKKAQDLRTDSIHGILQEPLNFMCIGQNWRDKLLMGMTGRVIEDDDVQVSKIYHYPLEQLGLATSDGKSLDIYVVKERLSAFQARSRFPKTLNPDHWTEYNFNGVFGGVEKDYYRINIPVEVVRNHVMDIIKDDYVDTKRIIDYLFPLKKDKALQYDTFWADIWLCDEGVMSIDIIPFRRIIIPKMSPPFRVNNYARGQGEKAMPLMLTLTELDVINLDSYEKTYTPAWSVVDDIQRLGLDLSRGQVTFKEKGMDDPTPLSLKAEIRSMIEFQQFKQSLYDRIMYLDVFELQNKSRMPTAEVEMRRTDDMRKMSLYIIQDHADDLNPTVLTINRQINERLKENDALANKLLQAKYVSELAMANKAGIINQSAKVLGMAEQTTKIVAEESEINDECDFVEYFKNTVAKSGQAAVMRNKEDAEKRRQQRRRKRQLAVQAAEGEALTNAGKAMAANTRDQASVGKEGAGGSPNQVPQGA